MLSLYFIKGALSQIDEEVLFCSVSEQRGAYIRTRRKEDRITAAAASCLLHFGLCDTGYADISDEFIIWEGKPHFTDPNIPVKFNLSHTVSRENDCFAAAVLLSDKAEVGVDIEFPRRLHNRDALMRRLFTGAECDAVLSSETDFYHIWCAKEAFVKWTGEGFSRPLSSVSVDLIAQTAKSDDMICDLRWIEIGDCTICAAGQGLPRELCVVIAAIEDIVKK